MANGVTTYDYDEIDAVVGRLKEAANEIERQADGLYGPIKTIIDEQEWTGTTAHAYLSRSTDLKNDLQTNREWLDRISMAMKSGADVMQETDKAGGKNLIQ